MSVAGVGLAGLNGAPRTLTIKGHGAKFQGKLAVFMYPNIFSPGDPFPLNQAGLTFNVTFTCAEGESDVPAGTQPDADSLSSPCALLEAAAPVSVTVSVPVACFVPPGQART